MNKKDVRAVIWDMDGVVADTVSLRTPLLQGVVFGAALFAIVGLLGAEGMTRFIYIGF